MYVVSLSDEWFNGILQGIDKRGTIEIRSDEIVHVIRDRLLLRHIQSWLFNGDLSKLVGCYINA